MKLKLPIFLSFILLSLALVGWSFYRSTMLKLTSTEAGGFGISPPYFKAGELRPGESYGSSITLLRSSDKNDQLVRVRLDAPEIESWLNIRNGDEFIISDGSLRRNVAVSVDVPEFAEPGEYQGIIYFYTGSGSGPGVKISLGARADIEINVIAAGSKYISNYDISDQELYGRLKGMFVTVGETVNRLYYVHPEEEKVTLIASATATMLFIENQAEGASNQDLAKIPHDLDFLSGIDTDRDGLPDKFETAVGTDITTVDSDGDNFPDRMELLNGYSPTEAYGFLPIRLDFARENAGRIFLQVTNEGQAWYVNPINLKRYFLPNYKEAWFIFMQVSKNITVSDFGKLIIE